MTETDVDEHGRPEPPHHGDEAATLLGFLDYQRTTFQWRCRGLSDGQLRTHVAPTEMTLAGMLKHLALVEDQWLTQTVSQEAMPEPWVSADWEADYDWDWHSAAQDSGDDLRALWTGSVERSRGVIKRQLAAGRGDPMAQSYPAWGGQDSVSLRWVLTHMIEEYARHNGHADLLRESIDGETGE
ncbi:MAG: DinB family protein [Ornithinimicrobium sp.]